MMMKTFALPLLVLLALPAQGIGAANAADRVAEMAPDHARRCIPGPHDPGRTRKLPGVAAHSSRAGHFSQTMDIYPHCRFDTREEAEAHARQNGLS